MSTWDLMSGDIKGHPGKEFEVNSEPVGPPSGAVWWMAGLTRIATVNVVGLWWAGAIPGLSAAAPDH